MKSIVKGVLGAFAFAALASTAMADDVTLTIATVNNGDMIRMQGLTDDFTAKNPGINAAVSSTVPIPTKVTSACAAKSMTLRSDFCCTRRFFSCTVAAMTGNGIG